MLSQFGGFYATMSVLLVLVAVVIAIQYLSRRTERVKVTLGVFAVVFCLWVVADVMSLPDKAVKGTTGNDVEVVEEGTGGRVTKRGELTTSPDKVKGTTNQDETGMDDDDTLDYEVSSRSLGYGIDYLRIEFDRLAEERGSTMRGDLEAATYDSLAYDMAQVTEEDSPVQVTTYLTKIGGNVSKVMVDVPVEQWEDHQDAFKDAVTRLVTITSPELSLGEVDYMVTRMMYVSNGGTRTEVRGNATYINSKSKATGMMFFIEAIN